MDADRAQVAECLRAGAAHLHHGIGVAKALEAERLGRKALAAVLARDLHQRCRGHGRHRAVGCGYFRYGGGGTGHRLEQAAVEGQRVEHHHQYQRHGEQCAGDGKDQVEGQAEQAQHIVGVHPEALQVAPGAHREQVLLQPRQVQQHARHQRQPVQHRDRTHEVDAADRDPQRVVQAIQERRQLADHLVARSVALHRGVAGQAGVGGHLPLARLVLPVGRDIGLALRRHDHVGTGRGLGVDRDQFLHEAVDRGRVGLGLDRRAALEPRRRLPHMQFVVEHGDRPGKEGDKQGPAGHQADPGMQRLVQAQGCGFHDGILRRRAVQPAPGRPGAAPTAHRSRPGWRRPARSRRRGWNGTAGWR
ncbi:hypothetical protein D9M72_289910 [compost metagenome]